MEAELETHDAVHETVPSFLLWINKNSKVISREGFYNLITKGFVPHYRVGGRIFLNRIEVMAALKVKGEKS